MRDDRDVDVGRERARDDVHADPAAREPAGELGGPRFETATPWIEAIEHEGDAHAPGRYQTGSPTATDLRLHCAWRP